MGISERKERKKEEMKKNIQDAAFEMFVKEGYAGTSLREIAKKIEYSAATIYLYYKDKDALFYDIQIQCFKKLIQSYAWRRFVVGLPTNALNKIFMSLYAEVDTEEYYDSIAKVLLKKKGSAKFPTNEDLKTALG